MITSPPPLTRIVLGLTGGIAAYKAAELTRLFVKAGVAVDVVMTAGARRFITPMTLQALSGTPVLTDLWASGAENGMGHIDLSRGADAIVVAPASADFLAKVANGHADDLLSTLTLARDCPLFVAPAMNRQMWANAANQRNVAQLAADGVIVLGPGTGDQACGETGEGRMQEPEEIFAAVVAWAQPKVLAGKRVLLTAGPTFEAIDPVRGITNTSSGKMGFALAQAAAEAGAAVTLVSGPTPLRSPAECRAHRRRERRADGRGGHATASTASTCSSRSPRSPTTRRRNAPPTKIKKDGAPLTLTLEADDRHPRDRRRAAGRALLRRLRRRNPRRRAPRRRKAPAQEASADHRQPRAGCVRQRRQRSHAVRRRRRASAAADGQARARAAAGRRDRGKRDRMSARTTARIALRILDERIRPHLPAYATPGSAGMDLRACIDAPLDARAGAGRARSHRHRDPHRGPRPRRGDPAALGARPQARHRARQPRRADRLRLPGPADGELLEPRRAHFTLQPMERLAQLVIVPVVQAAFEVVDDFAESRARRRVRQHGAIGPGFPALDRQQSDSANAKAALRRPLQAAFRQ